MKVFHTTPLSVLMALAALACPAASQAQLAQNVPQVQAQLASTSRSNAIIVYVSDFDLDVLYAKVPARTPPRSSPPANSASSSSPGSTTPKTTSSAPKPNARRVAAAPDASDSSAEETTADRANALVNAMSENLIKSLTEAGYRARRLPAGASLPNLGLRLRGVFAETDEKNRARRLLVGGEAVSPNMLLFVGVNNLARPEQPLYELANPPVPVPRHGPVITVTSYAPASRFELSRDPSDEELQKIAGRIVADLTALLNANSLSFQQ